MVYSDTPIFQKLAYQQLASLKSLDDDGEKIIPNEQEIRNHLIWKVASTCLAELVIASLAAGAACCFMATTAIPTMMITLITLIAITTLFHGTEALVDYSLSCDISRDGSLDNTSFVFPKLFVLNYLQGVRLYLSFRFAMFNNGTQGVLIHEMGHAFLAWLLFKNANPIIEILPGEGGRTTFDENALSKLGNLFGLEKAFMIVVAAGPIFATLETIALLAFAHTIKDTHPELRWRLVHMAIARVATHVFYALSALRLTSLNPAAEGHDFFILWKGTGIHPIAVAVTIIAIPILVQCALWKWASDQEQAELEELDLIS